MKKIIVILMLVTAGCGYQGNYRYECQDPENWEDPECNPPICLVDNMCTEIILGFDPNLENTTTTLQEVVEP